MALEAPLENLEFPEEYHDRSLPTMFDLPSEYPEELGLPDVYHSLQAHLFSESRPTTIAIVEGDGENGDGENGDGENCWSAGDLNIYYDSTKPLYHKRPDWFLVIGVPPLYQGKLRQSYVLWQEKVSPFLIVEFLSDSSSAEDLGIKEQKVDAPPTKWNVYEQIMKVPYYIVYDQERDDLKAWRLGPAGYVSMMLPGGRIRLPEIGLELRRWEGHYCHKNGTWLRFFDETGVILPTPEERERAAKEQERAAKEQERAAKEQALADREWERAGRQRERTAKEQALAGEERERFAKEQALAAENRERAAKEQALAENERFLELLKKSGIDPTL